MQPLISVSTKKYTSSVGALVVVALEGSRMVASELQTNPLALG